MIDRTKKLDKTRMRAVLYAKRVAANCRLNRLGIAEAYAKGEIAHDLFRFYGDLVNGARAHADFRLEDGGFLYFDAATGRVQSAAFEEDSRVALVLARSAFREITGISKIRR